MRTVLAAMVSVGAVLLGAGGAQADTITETYTLPSPLAGYGSENGSSFPEFNPALGTLNFVTDGFSATATFSNGGSSDDNTVVYNVGLGSLAIATLASVVGNSKVTATDTSFITDSSDLLNFTGAGSVSTSVEVLNEGVTSANISSTFPTESVTYNYTPVPVPVPQPGSRASLLILAVGLLGLEWIYRRRVRGAAGP